MSDIECDKNIEHSNDREKDDNNEKKHSTDSEPIRNNGGDDNGISCNPTTNHNTVCSDNHDRTTNKNENLQPNGGAMIVFSAPLAKHLSSQDGRFPTTYIGCRRIRPSSRLVQRHRTAGGTAGAPLVHPNGSVMLTAASTATSTIVYKIVDSETGVERRMNSQEKKARKQQLKLAEKLARQAHKRANKKRSLEHAEIESSPVNATTTPNERATESDPVTAFSTCYATGVGTAVSTVSTTNAPVSALGTEATASTATTAGTATTITSTTTLTTPSAAPAATASHGPFVPEYLQLALDPVALAQELADLKGARDGVPPVTLPAPLARLAVRTLHPPTTLKTDTVCLPPVLDDAWAATWAAELAEALQPAEAVRQADKGVRPMPYKLVPGVWSRLRPASLGQLSSADTKITPTTDEAKPKESGTGKTSVHVTATEDRQRIKNGTNSSVIEVLTKRSTQPPYSFLSIRPPTLVAPNGIDVEGDVAAILEVLHSNTHLHVACGAKFGCDYLLYDGPRNQRHAFAGLRIVRTPPWPSAYNLAGYVRCLNTAGKLALLATVVPKKDDDTKAGDCTPSKVGGQDGAFSFQRRVAIVDLALVKVIATTSKRPRKTLEQRIQNLAKPK